MNARSIPVEQETNQLELESESESETSSPLSLPSPADERASEISSEQIDAEKNFEGARHLDFLANSVSAEKSCRPDASAPRTRGHGNASDRESPQKAQYLETIAGKFGFSASDIHELASAYSLEALKHASDATAKKLDGQGGLHAQPIRYFNTCAAGYKAGNGRDTAKPRSAVRFKFNGAAQDIWLGLQMPPWDDRYKRGLNTLARLTSFDQAQQLKVTTRISEIGDTLGGKDYSTLLAEICEAVENQTTDKNRA